jgi:hypothetical protein
MDRNTQNASFLEIEVFGVIVPHVRLLELGVVKINLFVLVVIGIVIIALFLFALERFEIVEVVLFRAATAVPRGVLAFVLPRVLLIRHQALLDQRRF